VSLDEIDYIVRTRSTNTSSPRPIVVKFIRKIARDNFLASVRQKRKIITSDNIEVGGTTRNITINEHLTLRNKQLFYQSRLLGREKGYKYIWTRSGKVFMRREDSSPKIYISCLRDLETLRP
jgi:hypothetical protein